MTIEGVDDIQGFCKTNRLTDENCRVRTYKEQHSFPEEYKKALDMKGIRDVRPRFDSELWKFRVNLKKEYEQSSIKTKDMIFILFNKLTYLLEKMFVLDPTLFNNDKLGKKVRSFIENDLYKKYWLNNYILFDETFFMFINNHYRFLKFQQEEFGAVMGEIHQF